MASSAHTGGDWRAQEITRPTATGLISYGVFSHEDIPDDGEGGLTHSALLIGETASFSRKQAEANARLFAAALKLLDACRVAEEALRLHTPEAAVKAVYEAGEMEHYARARIRLEEAIARAEGREDGE